MNLNLIKTNNIILKITLLFLLLVPNLQAQEITEKVDVEIKTFISQITKTTEEILNDKSLTEEQQEVKFNDFASGIVDSKWISRFILGANWKTLTPEQQNEFETLYKEYLLKNYISSLKDYNTNLYVYKINSTRKNIYMVHTKTKDTRGKLIDVIFRLTSKDNKFYITDIIPEGISFISNQRTEVDSSISANGFDGFMEELKKRLNN